jgi:chromosome segregation ATPase
MRRRSPASELSVLERDGNAVAWHLGALQRQRSQGSPESIRESQHRGRRLDAVEASASARPAKARVSEKEGSPQKRVEALMKELKAAQDDAVRARHRGASLFEDNINQKKENQELKKKHEGALADAHNLRQSLDVFKRIKSELEAKIVQLQSAALQARHATPQKEPKGKEPAAWAVKGFEQMLAYTDVRPPRAQTRMQSVPATGAGPSSYAPAYADLPDDAFPVY